MKNTLILFISILCVLSNTYTQDIAIEDQEKDKHLYAGATIGLALPTILNQNNYGYSELAYKIGIAPQVSVYGGIDFHHKHMVEFGFQVGSTGQNYSDVIGGVDNDKEIVFNYIYMPVVYKWVMGNDLSTNAVKKYLLTGLQAGYNISSDVNWFINGAEVGLLDFINQRGLNENYSEILEDHSSSISDSELYNAFDLNILAGGGFQYFKNKNTLIYLELRGGFGLVDINNPEWRYQNNKGIYRSSFNAFASIRVGISFYMNKE